MRTPDVKLDESLSDLLTPREGEVLIALAQGYPGAAIAKELEVSVKTVSTHRARVLKKLRLRNNSDLTRYAIKRGYIDVDGNEIASIPADPAQPIAQPRSAIAQVENRS